MAVHCPKSRWITNCRVVATAAAPQTVEQVLCALADRPGLVALESLCGQNRFGRYSIVGWDPAATLICRSPTGPDPFDQLQKVLSTGSDAPAESHLPFIGGWLGYVGYEAGRFLERLPGRARNDLQLPLAWFGFYDRAAIYDHLQCTWTVVVAGDGDGAARINQRLIAGERMVQKALSTPCPESHEVRAVLQSLTFDLKQYLNRVERILEYIRAGEIYQANLTQRFSLPIEGTGMNLYRRLRRTNRGDYAAYLSCGGFEVLCSSPELFLEVRGRDVLTRPIKGTRPRDLDPEQDEQQQRELQQSEKDLAELAMIVDLSRNDLGRVCSAIRTEWPPAIESYDTVHHLVGSVSGRLRDGYSAVDLLRASFPPGSITGCPKIRAQEIIDEVEGVARGPYCGALGFLDMNGQMTMNVAIRTMITKDCHVHVHAGGGIVADSDPRLEFEELLAKARGMLAALDLSRRSLSCPDSVT